MRYRDILASGSADEVRSVVIRSEEIIMEKLTDQALFAKMRENFRNGVDEWTLTTEEMHDDQLGCVFPAAFCKGGFLCGEPYSHTADGEPIAAAFVERDGCYYGKYMTESAFKALT